MFAYRSMLNLIVSMRARTKLKLAFTIGVWALALPLAAWLWIDTLRLPITTAHTDAPAADSGPDRSPPLSAARNLLLMREASCLTGYTAITTADGSLLFLEEGTRSDGTKYLDPVQADERASDESLLLVCGERP